MKNSQQIVFSLDNTQIFTQELSLAAGSYLTGKIWSDDPLKKVSILKTDRQQVKDLMPFPGYGADIHFSPQNSGKYLLTVEGVADTKGTICLSEKLPAHIQEYSPLLSPRLQILSQDMQEQPETLEQFWNEIQQTGTPLIEPIPLCSDEYSDGKSIISFLWRGKQKNVRLLGGPSADHPDLIHLPDTDLWYVSFIVPNNAYFSYQLAPDVPEFYGNRKERKQAILATAQKDPLNHFPWLYLKAHDKYNTWSTIRLPAATKEIWIESEPKQKATIIKKNISIHTLNNKRDIYIYRTKGLNKMTPPEVLLIIFDGDKYIHQGKIPEILDNMKGKNEIPSVKAVFITNPSPESRSRELSCNPVFSDALVNEILPELQKEENLGDKNKKILIGSSYGGLISAYTAIRYPDIFCGVLSLSGSFWWTSHSDSKESGQEKQVISQLTQKKTLPIRWYFSAGIFENTWIFPANEELRSVLKSKGYQYCFRPVASSHDMLSWRTTFPDGLLYLLN
ncbi:hypothetical protein CSW98_02415 [Vibrio sp. HA2012]|nr:hypothetical protein CSW98_02415 [Vibrio sp. HA2012]